MVQRTEGGSKAIVYPSMQCVYVLGGGAIRLGEGTGK